MSHRFCLALLAALSLPPAAAAPVLLTPGGDRNSFGASVSDDGQRVAFYSASDLTGGNADRNFEVFLYDRPSGSLQQVTNRPEGIRFGSQSPSLSGDGKRIVFQEFSPSGSLALFQTRSYHVPSNSFTTLTGPPGFFESSDINRDGSVIAVQVGNTGLRLYDTAAGSFGDVITNRALHFSLSGDGTRLAWSDFAGGLFVHDVLTGSTTTVFASGGGVNLRPDFSADGRFLAYTGSHDPLGLNADGDTELFLYQVDGGQLRQLTQSVGGTAQAASISGDGSRIAFSSNANLRGGNADGNTELWLYDLLIDEITQITDTSAGSFSIGASLSADGLSLAYSSSADLAGLNPGRVPQIWLQSLAPSTAEVPLPASPALAVLALGLLALVRRPQARSRPL
jgi:Tol biopolymer transport system component